MLCGMIMVAGLSISPCDITALEASPLKPEERCIILMDTGKRYVATMSCANVHHKTKLSSLGNNNKPKA